MYAVRDRMTAELVTLSPQDDLALARDLLESAHVRHLPVVEAGKLVGLLTQRDLLRASSNLPPALVREVHAADVMQRELVTARPGMPLRRAARLMLERKIGCLPVVDASGTLLGILTEGDLAELAEELITELDRVTTPLANLSRH